ncbi:BCD family MFS transporter [Rhodoplanes sp. TEM]|uniref:BCD family MFS transporter n=1 Tax=Rhodoplanes tepidamans TaxID=200616 RepID=A0ABT5J4T6_RHOTP|nr:MULTISPECIES: BCD family MFS transporter [Rhodoplanes]MDC7784598.1 BCD family MFS transporter [Rhodoplanes tepidamans]MDC7982890.1 BCD family MFS transporter [Rhodoplanes sp. TEM]MDQ0355826.1 BCD family chlorophyll transporter-like MFS transporter [Rhodoplanes tepidamans]
MTPVPPGHIGLLGIVRLGLVQTALGAVVVLTTSTLNRVMVVEFALPAMLPGALVAIHYAVQVLRPRWGYGSDTGGRVTPWIIGGMATLALSGAAAAAGTAMLGTSVIAGVAIAALAFLGIGVGVGAAGTSLLVLLAKRVHPDRRAVAATIVWVMMIVGFIVTAGGAGHLLDPFSPARLVTVATSVSAIAFVLSLAAVWGVEGDTRPAAQAAAPGRGEEARKVPFREALAQVWAEPEARRFAMFVLISMLAYSAQDLILEPFAGTVFGLTPGDSTKLSGLQHSGVLVGMVTVGIAGTGRFGRALASMRGWCIGGCIASAVALASLALGAFAGPGWPLHACVFMLGVTNGAYAVAAIGSMMGLASNGRENREGVRMGLWGAAQAISFGVGGFLGTLASDVARALLGSPVTAYATVFTLEAALFLVSAVLAARVHPGRIPESTVDTSQGEALYAPAEAGRS